MSNLAKTFLAAAAARAALESESSEVSADAVATADATSTDAVETPVEAAVVEETPAAAAAVSTESDDTQPGADAEAPVASDTEPTVAEIQQISDNLDAAAAAQDAAEIVAPIAAAEPVEETSDVSVEGEGDEDVSFDDQNYFAVDDAEDDEEGDDALYEMSDAANRVRESTDANTTLEAAIDGLKDIRQAMEALDNRGGLSKECFQFLKIGIESHLANLGIEDAMPALGLSLESFAGEEAGTLYNVSLEGLDDLLTSLEAAQPNVKQQVISAEQRLSELARTRAPQLRSVVSTEALGLENDALMISQTNAMVASQEVIAESLTDSVTSLENLLLQVREQNENGGLSFEAIACLSLALEAHTKPLGLPEAQLVESFESMTFGDRAQVSVENIQVSLEGVLDALKNLAKRAVSEWARATNYAWMRVMIHKSRLKGLIKQAQQQRGQKAAGIAVPFKSKKLHRRGKIEKDMAPWLVDFAILSEILMNKFGPAAHKALEANIAKARAVQYDTVQNFEKGLHAVVSGWKDPRDLLTDAQLAFDVPGGRLFFKSEELKYTGDNADAKKLDKLAHENQPTRLLWRGDDSSVPADENAAAMAPADVLKVAEAFYKAIEQSSAFMTYVRQVASAYAMYPPAWLIKGPRRMTIIDAGFGGIRSEVKDERKALADAISSNNWMRFHVNFDALTTFMSVAAAFAKYAKASLKAATKAVSSESFEDKGIDEISMEGADPKKLRPGVKVKMSHGHGKVTKVLTAPFMAFGKHHHATKDDPRFEVKDQHGYKTYHKASALTIV